MKQDKNTFKTKRIKGVKRIGERLKSERLRQNITLEKAEEETKIRARYIEAMEVDDYTQFSSSVYATGFLRRYCEFLGLDADKVISQQKLIASQPTTNQALGIKPIKQGPRFMITPRFFLIIFLALLLGGILGYVGISLKRFSAPPPLTITSPQNNTTVNEQSVLIEGTTDPGALVSVNNELVALGADGRFSQRVILLPGINTTKVTAKNRVDRATEISLNIFYETTSLSEPELPEQSLDNDTQNGANNDNDALRQDTQSEVIN